MFYHIDFLFNICKPFSSFKHFVGGDESCEICSVVEADRLDISSYILWTHDGGAAVVRCMWVGKGR